MRMRSTAIRVGLLGLSLILFAAYLVKFRNPRYVNHKPSRPLSPCEVAQSPEKFDGKLIRIDAYISREFEDSTLHAPACPEEALINVPSDTAARAAIWVAFGDEERLGMTSPAPTADNGQLKEFQSVLMERGRLHQMTRATMTGTFHAGEATKQVGHVTAPGGYGHMGCCSLFEVSRVESFESNYAGDLNYSWGDWNINMPKGCQSEQMLGLPTNETIRSWQQIANQRRDDLHYDSRRTAEDHLRRLKSGEFNSKIGGTTSYLWLEKLQLNLPANSRPIGTLLETSSTAYLRRYEFTEPSQATRFVIVVARPYWLTELAGSPERVIWAPVGSSVIRCIGRGAPRKVR
jgi:hypothetical protein